MATRSLNLMKSRGNDVARKRALVVEKVNDIYNLNTDSCDKKSREVGLYKPSKKGIKKAIVRKSRVLSVAKPPKPPPVPVLEDTSAESNKKQKHRTLELIRSGGYDVESNFSIEKKQDIEATECLDVVNNVLMFTKYIEENVTDEFIYRDKRIEIECTSVIKNAEKKGYVEGISVRKACCAVLTLILQHCHEGGRIISPALADFLDSHLPFAFSEQTLMDFLDPSAKYLWKVILDHVEFLVRNHHAPFSCLTNTFASIFLAGSPDEWSRPKERFLTSRILEIFSISEKAGGELAALFETLIEDTDFILVPTICEIAKGRMEVVPNLVIALVKVYLQANRCVSLLDYFLNEEVKRVTSSAGIFRGDSWVSLLFREYWSIVSKSYLKIVFSRVVNMMDEDILEYDPSRLTEVYSDLQAVEIPEFVSKNQQKLLMLADLTLDYIETTSSSFPLGMKNLIQSLQKVVCEKFEDTKKIRVNLVASIVFSNFLCPGMNSKDFCLSQIQQYNVKLLQKCLNQVASGQPLFLAHEQFMNVWVFSRAGRISRLLNSWTKDCDGIDIMSSAPLPLPGDYSVCTHSLNVIMQQIRDDWSDISRSLKKNSASELKTKQMFESIVSKRLRSLRV